LLDRINRKPSVNDVLVLSYHAVSEDWPAGLAIAPDRFRDHVRCLVRRGYRGVTFSEAALGTPEHDAVAITFDDAYRSVLEVALPILSEAGFPATVFAPTAFIGSDKAMVWPGIDQWQDGEYADELLPMSWSELEALAVRGWEIGSHTRRHPVLPRLATDVLDEELRRSRADVEDRLGRPCLSLAYPYGYRDDRVIDATRRAGYAAAARTARGRFTPPNSPLDWPRIMITRQDAERRFRIKISPRFRRFRATRAWILVQRARRAPDQPTWS
jgi:peptidoglycan/xylan/chitin deacetylase (PgdA/CDA1 family)